ncbi:hypothetical protein Tcan_16767 [Toxocara canis]|uniref:Uncharacterized protein n=2 Tax=Toxocara canis TaxID=6265 RepID=A0A0B2UXC9_TOXCA|nr:hypothetical protein Tcan_16767 [Toxocara canis]VDM39650.1 unnamed protein product [Toxocara canis]
MQNVRGRVGPLGRRHMRVRFNMGTNTESPTQAHKQPQSPARDDLLKRLIGRINRRERELSTCLQPSTDTSKVLKDSLTCARIKHETALLNELKHAIDRITSNTCLPFTDFEANYYKRKVITDLKNWIARNEAELDEIKTMDTDMEGRHSKLLAENEHLAQIATNLRWLSNSSNTPLGTTHSAHTTKTTDRSSTNTTLVCNSTQRSDSSKEVASSAKTSTFSTSSPSSTSDTPVA